MNKVKLKSRYNHINTEASFIDDHTAVIRTNSFVRIITSPEDNSKEAIDFDGGPFLRIGDEFMGKKIAKIEESLTLILEDND